MYRNERRVVQSVAGVAIFLLYVQTSGGLDSEQVVTQMDEK